MQYILSKDEMEQLVSKSKLRKKDAQLRLLLHEQKESSCERDEFGCCDDCKIASLNTSINICDSEKYSK